MTGKGEVNEKGSEQHFNILGTSRTELYETQISFFIINYFLDTEIKTVVPGKGEDNTRNAKLLISLPGSLVVQ